MSAKYHFIPAVRQGIAGAINREDTLGAGMTPASGLFAFLNVNDQETARVKVQVLGPGDVAGIQRAAIIRTDPAPWTHDFEPNFFPQIEFDNPDFPWLFTPAKADSQGRLRPWLSLVVVRQQEGVSLNHPAGQPLPVLSIKSPAKPSAELPDLSESWAWAHAQVAGSDTEPIGELLVKKPAQNLSRLICPRRLVAKEKYIAALVPAFEVGKKTGLGLSLSEADLKTLQPTWTSGAGAPPEIDLPVYYHWTFDTGEGDDFVSLIRKLKYRPLPDKVGRRNITADKLPYDLPGLGIFEIEGALRPVKARLPNTRGEPGWICDLPGTLQTVLDGGEDASETMAAAFGEQGVKLSGKYLDKWIDVPGSIWRIQDGEKTYHLRKSTDRISVYELPPVFVEKLRDILNIPGNQSADEDPVVGLPVYGSIHAEQSLLPAIGMPSWLNELNLDPKQRIAAGMGTLVVQDQQENLMESAWAQLHDRQQNQTLNQMQLGRETSNALLRKHVNAGTNQEDTANNLLRKTSPVFKYIQQSLSQSAGVGASGTPGVAMMKQLPQSSFPAGVFTAAFRRISRQGGVASKRMAPQAQAGTFLSFIQMTKVFMETNGTTTGPAVTEGDLFSIANLLLNELNPDYSFRKRAEETETLTAPRPDEDPLGAVLTAPRFDFPMYRYLQDISQDFLLFGAEHFPEDAITLLETNPEFIVSFMVGLNHEMSRELLWRDYPVNRRATCFQTFWDAMPSASSTDQINPIKDWKSADSLGSHLETGGQGEQLVLLIRGDLLRRFPSATIALMPFEAGKLQENKIVRPQFQGRLDPDLYFFGFPMQEETIRSQGNWHFIIQQQPTQPRFGLDNPASGHYAQAPASKADLSWGHLVSSETELHALSHASINSRLKNKVVEGNLKWGYNSAHMALLTLRKPVRIAIPANMILPA